METQKQVAQHLKASINWQRFATLADGLGRQLNDAQWRFFKAIVLESSMEAYSDGSVKYVGQEGCDLLVTIEGVEHRVEMKYMEGALYNKRGRVRDRVKGVTLMNSKGSNTHKDLPLHYADFLLVVGLRGACLLSKKNLRKYITINGDSISADFPVSRAEIVADPQQMTVVNKQQIDLRSQLVEAVKRTVSSIQ